MWPFQGIAKQIQYTYISAFVLILYIVDRIQVFEKNESMSFHFKFHENSFLKFVVYNFGQIFLPWLDVMNCLYVIKSCFDHQTIKTGLELVQDECTSIPISIVAGIY